MIISDSVSLVLQLLFWTSFLAIMHTYGLYPILISKVLKVKQAKRSKYQEKEGDWPVLDVVMAMYNEEAVIEETLKSIIASDYPKGKLRIHIGSDNSTDNSHDIVKSLQQAFPHLNLEIFGGRNGKIKIINSLIEALPEDKNAVLLLCDANVVWAPDLAKRLASHFKDESIGIVACNVLDEDVSDAGISVQEEAYVNRENIIKYKEGELWGVMMGAFGACYALRRNCYESVPEHFNVDDFYETIACYEQGYKGIVDLEAICYEKVSEDISEEFRRKRRISKGNFQNLKRFSKFLLPWNCGSATWFAFWSHKGLRWFGPLFLIAMVVTSVALAFSGKWLYVAAMTGITGTFCCAALDIAADVFEAKGRRFGLFRFIRYFYSMNLALLMGAFDFCKGVKNSVWEPTKRVATKSPHHVHREHELEPQKLPSRSKDRSVSAEAASVRAPEKNVEGASHK